MNKSRQINCLREASSRARLNACETGTSRPSGRGSDAKAERKNSSSAVEWRHGSSQESRRRRQDRSFNPKRSGELCSGQLFCHVADKTIATNYLPPRLG